MINLIYLCFYATDIEKKDVFKVLINPKEMTNYCQESVQGENSIELKYKFLGIDIFSEIDFLYKITVENKIDSDQNNISPLRNFSIKNSKYLEVIKLVNKYFQN